MATRDRPVPGGAAYFLVVRFGQLCSGFGLGLAIFGSGGVASMRRSTSSRDGSGRCLFMGKYSHG